MTKTGKPQEPIWHLTLYKFKPNNSKVLFEKENIYEYNIPVTYIHLWLTFNISSHI